ncbi:MAG TPA: MFS transporter [Bryobacteraceae bacterium]|jgi:hypothetical protein|nr:MFS transporter [Bryobacteraceae bacterium]
MEDRRLRRVFLFPILMNRHGLPAAELAAALVSALGIFVTVFMLPETKGKTLEELNEEAQSGDACDPPGEKMLAARDGANDRPKRAIPTEVNVR